MRGKERTIFCRNLPKQIESAVGSKQETDGRDTGAGAEHTPGERVLIVRVVKVGCDAVWRCESWSVEVHGGGLEMRCAAVGVVVVPELLQWLRYPSCGVQQQFGLKN